MAALVCDENDPVSANANAGAAAVMQKSAPHNDTALKNMGLVFLKPHADSDAAEALVTDTLESAGCTVISKRRVEAAEIDGNGIIDAHYGSLAVAAMTTPPESLTLSAAKQEAFEAQFGVSWDAARKVTNPAALAELGCDGLTLEKMWRAGECLKLAPGTYVAELLGSDSAERTFTVNGFYPAMRQEFVAPGAAVRVLVVSWDPAAASSGLGWAAFRDDLIGATDPAAAASSSLRGAFRAQWAALGLARAPVIACNCVHASAGPLEGLKERCVWTGADLARDALGAALLVLMSRPTLEAWLAENPSLTWADGRAQKVFDATEGLDAAEALAAIAALPEETRR